jgi:hypothetical protein
MTIADCPGFHVSHCTMKSKRHGIINELFPGVPSDVNGVFRYKNGMLTFKKKKKPPNNFMSTYR